MSDPLISIVILSMNQADKTIKCFQSIYKHCKIPYEIIWVDNGSHESEFKKIKKNVVRENLRLKLIKFNTNKGFVIGVNAAIPELHKRSKYVILLNNDTEIGPATFEKLLEPFKLPNVGITSCVTQSAISWQCAMHLNKRWRSLKMPSFSGDVVTYTKHLEQRYAHKCIEVKKTNFAFFCVAIPKKIFVEELKGLDTDFEIGLGEDDYACHRLRALGYKFYLVLDAFVYHHHRTTFKALGISVDNLRRKNVKTLREKIKKLNGRT